MATNLTAFENLKENVKDSLSSQEKTDLRKISPEDIRSQKDKIGEKVFTVSGKQMKLKDIVTNLVFDENGNSAKLKMSNNTLVTIAKVSELGAAIQVYAIANNKSIGNAGIDGWVGKDTVKGLQSTQNSIKAEETTKKSPETVDEEDDLTSRLSSLLNSDYRTRVGKYKDAKYDLLYGDVADKEGAFKHPKKILDSNNKETGIIEIQYRSDIGKKEYQKVRVDAKLCKTGSKYSANKFGKAVEEAIAKKEAALKKAEDDRKARETLEANKKIIVSGVESYNITNFSKKAQSYLKDKDFVLNNNINTKSGIGTGIHFEGDKLKIDNLVTIEKADALKFCSNGAFNATEFKKYMGPVLDTKADTYYQNQAKAAIQDIKNTTVSTGNFGDVNKAVHNADSKVSKIRGLGVTIPDDVQKTLDKKKAEVKIIEDYNTVSKGVNAKIASFESKIHKSMSLVEMKALKTEVQTRYDRARLKTLAYGGKNVYEVYTKLSNGETAYQNTVVRLKRVYDSIS